MGGVPKISARTGVHGSHQHNRTGICECTVHTGNGYGSILDRLAEHLDGGPGKLRQFIQKEHAVVGKRKFPRAGNNAPTGKAGGRKGMMGRTKRAGMDQGTAMREDARDGMDFCGFHLFI